MSCHTMPCMPAVSQPYLGGTLSYLEVVVALLDQERKYFSQIRNFAVLIATVTVLGLAGIAYTQLGLVWLIDVSGLAPELANFALFPIKILAVFPALSVLLSLQRGTLIHSHRTPPITRATLLEVTTVGIVLTVGIHLLDLIGATAAAIAILSGRIVGTAWLTPAWINALRSTDHRG